MTEHTVFIMIIIVRFRQVIVLVAAGVFLENVVLHMSCSAGDVDD